MAIRATNLIPSRSYENFKHECTRLKTDAELWVTEFSSTFNATRMLTVLDDIGTRRKRLITLTATPGIVQEAIDMEDDVTYDVVAEWLSFRTSIEAVITHIKTEFPVDASGNLQERKFPAAAFDTLPVPNTLPANAPAVITLRTLLQAMADEVI